MYIPKKKQQILKIMPFAVRSRKNGGRPGTGAIDLKKMIKMTFFSTYPSLFCTFAY